MSVEKTITDRGFGIIEFTDIYGKECSIQKSSLARADAIWFGISKVKAEIMTSKGWENYEIPESVCISTRMHLTREAVAELLPILTKFVETGEI
jgi:hypothetical protein